MMTKIVFVALIALSAPFAQANPQEGGPVHYSCWAWKCGERGYGTWVSSGVQLSEGAACQSLTLKCTDVCCELPPTCSGGPSGESFNCIIAN